MTYLYGDSKPSPFDFNYLAFLRTALDGCVELLLAQRQLELVRERRTDKQRIAAEEIRRVEEIGAVMRRALDPFTKTPVSSPSTDTANEIDRCAADAVAERIEQVEASLGQDLDEIEQSERRIRANCQAILEPLLVQFDLPEATLATHLVLKDGTTYQGLIRQQTPYGIAANLNLDVPHTSLLARNTRMSRFWDDLDVNSLAEDEAIRKAIRNWRKLLGKSYLVELSQSDDQTQLKVRSAPESESDGFDISIEPEPASVVIFEVAKNGLSPTPQPLSQDERDALILLAKRVVEAAGEVTSRRNNLVDILLDDAALAESVEPRDLVDRLIRAIAPQVAEIARHSRSPEELVLRRPIADDRREEIYVTREDLAQKLALLPVSDRKFFAPLQLVADLASLPQQSGGPPRSVESSADVDGAEELSSGQILSESPYPAVSDDGKLSEGRGFSLHWDGRKED